MPKVRAKPLFPSADHDADGNWSTRTGVTLDAGDATDIEESIQLNKGASTDEDVQLAGAAKAHVLLHLGTETGSADMTVDSVSESSDGGTTWRVVDYINRQITAAGEYILPFDPRFSQGANRVRLDVTATQLSGSHKFATSWAELHYTVG